jgi:hypothetical protein
VSVCGHCAIIASTTALVKAPRSGVIRERLAQVSVPLPRSARPPSPTRIAQGSFRNTQATEATPGRDRSRNAGRGKQYENDYHQQPNAYQHCEPKDSTRCLRRVFPRHRMPP